MSGIDENIVGWVHCYKERNIMERNYSPEADAYEDTMKYLLETDQVKEGDRGLDAVKLEWYYRLFEVRKTVFNGLDLIGEIYDDEPGGTGIRWNRAFTTTGVLCRLSDEDVRETMDIWAVQKP